MLFIEQDRGRPGARGHHVGDPWSREICFEIREKAHPLTVII